jgi:hypothetical protein
VDEIILTKLDGTAQGLGSGGHRPGIRPAHHLCRPREKMEDLRHLFGQDFATALLA